jgi:hypothetical protein
MLALGRYGFAGSPFTKMDKKDKKEEFKAPLFRNREKK